MTPMSPTKNKFIGHAYPDFGFKDELGFELRGEQLNNEQEERAQVYSIWKYLSNYIQDRPKFERFNNHVDRL